MHKCGCDFLDWCMCAGEVVINNTEFCAYPITLIQQSHKYQPKF